MQSVGILIYSPDFPRYEIILTVVGAAGFVINVLVLATVLAGHHLKNNQRNPTRVLFANQLI